MTIRHVFMWSVADEADADFVYGELSGLDQKIPGLQNWSIGRQEKTGTHSSIGTWHFVLMSDFEDQAALDAYQSHPAHEAVLQRILPKYRDWAVVDYIL